MTEEELLLELTNEIMGRTASTAAQAILPIIHRLQIEAGEKVRGAVLPHVEWAGRETFTGDNIRNLDIPTILKGESHD